MTPLKGVVKNGRIVVDEPTDLPEGTEVELVPVEDEFDAEERAQLLAAIEEVASFLGRSKSMRGPARGRAGAVAVAIRRQIRCNLARRRFTAGSLRGPVA